MKPLLLLISSLFLVGCMTSPVENSGGMGASTVSDTNVSAIVAAAQTVFPQYGYSMGPSNFPDSISFDKPSGAFGNIVWGSFNSPVTFRATLNMTPIPGTNDYRVSVRVTRVQSAGQAGFEDTTRMAGFWAGEFRPILRQIQATAAGAGSATTF